MFAIRSPFSGSKVILAAILASLIGASTSDAAVQKDSVTLGFSGFAYESNFWAAHFPSTATTSGPAPVSDVSLSFSMEYVAPLDEAFQFGQTDVTLSDVVMNVTRQDVAGLASASDPITSSVFSITLQKYGSSSSAFYGISGRLNIFTESAGIYNPLVRLSFVLPHLFEPGLTTDLGQASYKFNSPKPFDSPTYAVTTAGISATRTVVSTVAAPVPLPMGVWLGMTALACLMLVGASRRPVTVLVRS